MWAGEIAELTREIVEWADSAFPKRTPQSAFLKFFGEIGELVDNPSNPDEYADICIMLFDLANMHGVDIAQAIKTKMNINRSRTWVTTALGTWRHEGPHDG